MVDLEKERKKKELESRLEEIGKINKLQKEEKEKKTKKVEENKEIKDILKQFKVGVSKNKKGTK